MKVAAPIVARGCEPELPLAGVDGIRDDASFAPRISVILPVGDADKELGNDTVGFR
jgi:hypothetical protein